MPKPSHKKRVALATLGCKVNQFESAAFLSTLAEREVEMVEFAESAEVYIVNTCAVTARAAQESRQLIRRALKTNPEARLVVTGCYAQIAAQEILDIVDQPLCIVGNGYKDKLVEIALNDSHCDLEMFMSDIGRRKEICPLTVRRFEGRTRASLKIQDGCNSFCSYCVVPFTRGRSRSLAPELAVAQARIYAAEGHREVVITGIHTGTYGHDFTPASDLVALLRRLLAECPLRYRISSLDPGEITPELLQLLAAEPLLLPHLHIPLQSGDDAILARMNRRYTGAAFGGLVRRIREILPEAAIGVDVMVGFPGEDEAAFRHTYDLLAGLPVTYLHIFPYSKRPGTMAARLEGQVSKEVKTARIATLRELEQRKRREFYGAQLGKVIPVLVERGRRGKLLTGFTDNYVPVRFAGSDALMNSVVQVRLGEVVDDWVRGTVVAEA
ncbi:MAG: tRNA (N(6)-L-threonylcarbamoyladenosine(37)-C(2))-methylthiotransferase MtaB [Desulfobulbaceae bacterium]|nr:tRNA (N(6)-L-threonylcarbamoyladenosine(37)-C(2))-methylthiotransferase MtaB [Desulfobulbaceae bacterium]